MADAASTILVVNGGSSSIKFALYGESEPLAIMQDGQIEGIGTPHTQITFRNIAKGTDCSVSLDPLMPESIYDFLINWLEKTVDFKSVQAIGHRIVQGQRHAGPAEITEDLMNEFSNVSDYDPEHMVSEIKLIRAFQKRYPDIRQIACFDTSFHATMPAVARRLPIPRRYDIAGMARFGFHGLSYSYLMDALRAVAGNSIANGRIILAHLGNGASMAAIRDGKSIDTTMGFSPTAGLVMGTRTGDLDPGVALYLMQSEHLTPQGFSDIVNHQSGLLGISETSSDMRDLLEIESTDHRAAEAVELFCYQAKKWIGSYAAVLDGLDTLVFTGGIGEHSPQVRQRICKGLGFLGVEIDEEHNKDNESVISKKSSKVTVRVMKTNEQLMIARLVTDFLHHPNNHKA